jgi:hypothetical protein
VIPLLTNNPANATNPRIDLVVARIQDSFYSGAVDTATIEMVTGVPAASPLVPAAPANSLILAQILIPASAAVVLPANITDRRVPAGTQPVKLADVVLGASTATLTIPYLPPGFRSWTLRGNARLDVASTDLKMRFGTGGVIDTAAHYNAHTQVDSGVAAPSLAQALLDVYLELAYSAGSGDIAGYFSEFEATIYDPAVSGIVKLMNFRGGFFTTAGGQFRVGNGSYTVTTPLDTVAILGISGNVIAGSYAVVYGNP